MRKAFTMLELIMVILVVAILSIIMIPRFSDDKLREAADQILSHIRYTQHLAMIDDRFDPSDSNWTVERWQIGFNQCSGNGWYYYVGHDLDHGGGIGNSESAINPADGLHLFSQNTCVSADNESGAVLITKKYGINNVTFTNCGDNKYIAFDNIGRPYKTTLGSQPYDILTNTCRITFTANDGNFTISVEPETGYAHLSSINY
jgi:prepilin-type N-terminal cleavage/methylation domain-containing protein